MSYLLEDRMVRFNQLDSFDNRVERDNGVTFNNSLYRAVRKERKEQGMKCLKVPRYKFLDNDLSYVFNTKKDKWQVILNGYIDYCFLDLKYETWYLFLDSNKSSFFSTMWFAAETVGVDFSTLTREVPDEFKDLQGYLKQCRDFNYLDYEACPIWLGGDELPPVELAY